MTHSKYICVYKKKIHPYPVLLVNSAYYIFFKRYLKMDFLPAYVIIDNGMWNMYLDSNNFVTAMEKMLKLYNKGKQVINRFTRQFKGEAANFLKESSRLTRLDYKSISNKGLLLLYEKFNNGYIQSFIYGEPPAQLLKEILEKKLRKIILSKVKDEYKASDILGSLVLPCKDTFTDREERSLLKIALIPEQSRKTALQNHYVNFNWISVDYNGKAFTLKDFERRLNLLIKSNPKKQLKRFESKHKERYELQKKIISELQVDKNTIDLINSIQDCILLMDSKKEAYTKSHYHVQFLLAEIAKRNSLTYPEVCYLTPEEMHNLLLGRKKINKKSLEKRFNSSIYYSLDQNIRFLSGIKSRAILPKIGIGKEKSTKLNGMCGNPGNVIGKARIILTDADFHKMRKGEILITAFTTPDFLYVIKKASAIVTDIGGITSHSSIIARELNIPCLVNTGNATSVFHDGDRIELDTEKGFVRKIS